MKTMKNQTESIKKIKMPFSAIISICLNIFFPKRCVNCKKSVENFLCLDCVKKIEKVKTPLCPSCGKISKFSKFCSSCRTGNLTGIITAARYESGPIKEMIHHLKYSGIIELIPPLGELIVERLKRDFPTGKIVVVPVPLYKKREFMRGFNQSELLARYVSKCLSLSGGLALERVRNTESQVKLSGEMRRINLKNAFRCVDRELVSGKTILLIDDVTTTGSTLDECAKILCDNGAKRVFGVVVAKR